MVDLPPLLAGNLCLGSASANLFAGSGVPNPTSQACFEVVGLGESDPVPLVSSPHSVSSSEPDGFNGVVDAAVGAALSPDLQDIFRAAQSLTHKDRLEAVEERKKNQCLMDFIKSLGFSAKDVSSFACSGSIPRVVDDNDAVVLNQRIPGSVSDDLEAPILGAQTVFDKSSNLGVSGVTPSVSASSVVSSWGSEPSVLEAVPALQSDGSPSGLPLASPTSASAPPSKTWSDVVACSAQTPEVPSFCLEYIPPPPPLQDGPILIRPPLLKSLRKVIVAGTLA